MMTTADLQRLKAAFDVKPSFEFPSPEGQVGYPPEMLKLSKSELEELIEARRKYEQEAREGAEDDVPPIPDDVPPVHPDAAPATGSSAPPGAEDPADADAPAALSD